MTDYPHLTAHIKNVKSLLNVDDSWNSQPDREHLIWIKNAMLVLRETGVLRILPGGGDSVTDAKRDAITEALRSIDGI